MNKLDDFLLYEQKRSRIENAVKSSHEAIYDAIRLINDSKTPVLNKVEQKNIKGKSHLLEYYIPENEGLYEYFDKYNHKIMPKHDDFLIINILHDFEYAVETLKHYDKYIDDVKEYKNADRTPIITIKLNH